METLRSFLPFILFFFIGATCDRPTTPLFNSTISNSTKTFQFALSDDIKTLDPANAYDPVSLSVMPFCIESLYQYAFLKTPYTTEPLLANGMPDISEDKKVYTIHIKKGIRFQDDPAFPEGKGRELKASDFIYAWKRLLLTQLQSPGQWIFEGKVIGYSELKQRLAKAHTSDDIETILKTPIQGFKTPDDYTLKIYLLQPYPQLIYVLTMGFTAPVPPEAVKKYSHEGLSSHMVGTGPFILAGYMHGSPVLLKRNPNFRGEHYPTEGDSKALHSGLLKDSGKPIPFIHEIRIEIIKQEQTAWLKFQAGLLDITTIPKHNYSAVMTSPMELTPELKSKGVRLLVRDEATIWYLTFNMKDPLLGQNLKLRKAIAKAIDRDKIIALFMGGFALKPRSIIPSMANGGYEPKFLTDSYSPNEAKRLLYEAGFPEGKGLPRIHLDMRSSDTRSKQLAEFIALSLAEVGVSIDIELNSFPAFLQKERNGNLQFFLGAWSADYLDPVNFLQLLYGKNISPGPNSANWTYPEFDALFEKIESMAPGKERNRLVQRAEEIALKNSVWIMLYQPIRYDLAHSWVRNFRPSSIFLNDTKYVDMDLEKKLTFKR